MGLREFTEEELAALPSAFRGQIGMPEDDASLLVNEISRCHGATWAEVKSPSRVKHLVTARRAIYVALRQLGWSYPAIGRLVDRDHTTVLKDLERYGK